MVAVSRQPVDTRSDQEVGPEVLRGAEQLVDVALTIADMDACGRIVEQRGGLAQVLQPAKALFLFDGHAGRLIFFLSAAVPLNFERVQNLTAEGPKGRPSSVTARLECIRSPHTVRSSAGA